MLFIPPMRNTINVEQKGCARADFSIALGLYNAWWFNYLPIVVYNEWCPVPSLNVSYGVSLSKKILHSSAHTNIV